MERLDREAVAAGLGISLGCKIGSMNVLANGFRDNLGSECGVVTVVRSGIIRRKRGLSVNPTVPRRLVGAWKGNNISEKRTKPYFRSPTTFHAEQVCAEINTNQHQPILLFAFCFLLFDKSAPCGPEYFQVAFMKAIGYFYRIRATSSKSTRQKYPRSLGVHARPRP